MRTKMLAIFSGIFLTAQAVHAESKVETPEGFKVFYRDFRTGLGSTTLKPYTFVKRVIIKRVVQGYIDDLTLEPAAKKRLKKRIASREFLDESIPLILWTKETYSLTPEDREDDFFHSLTKVYSGHEYPGMNHSLFQFPRDIEKLTVGAAGFGLQKDLLSGILAVYDVVYLQKGLSPLKDKVPISDELIKEVKTSVKQFLLALSSQAGEGNEIGDVARAIAENEARLETFAISVIDILEFFIKRLYQTFTEGSIWTEAFNQWTKKDLEESRGNLRGNEIYKFLQNRIQRKFAIHVVVDGLQGHLIESLATPGSELSRKFLAQIGDEMRPYDEIKNFPLPSPSARLAPSQTWDFLKYLQTHTPPADAGYLPLFRNIFSHNANGIALNGISTTPTISVRNLPIAKTGAPVAGPNGTGIPNFHFVDRPTKRAYYFFGNDAVLLESLQKTNGMKTLFDRFSGLIGINCNSYYDDGAYFTSNGFISLAFGEKSRDLGDIICVKELQARLKVEEKLQPLREKTLNALLEWRGSWNVVSGYFNRRNLEQLLGELADLEPQGLPDYVLYYNPWPDHFAHAKGPFSDEIISPSGELNRMDYWVGKIYDIYKQAGVIDRTLIGMAGDHGLGPVKFLLNPEVDVIEALQNEGKKLVVEKISSDEGEGPKLNNRIHPKEMSNIDVVIASTAGGNYMLDFFVNQTDQYQRQPNVEDLKSWKSLSGDSIDWISELTTRLQTSLDYLAVRINNCNVDACETLLIGWRNGKKVEARIIRRGDRILYDSPGDLLGVHEMSRYHEFSTPELRRYDVLKQHCLTLADPHNEGTWCSDSAWRHFTRFTNRPDSVAQLAHLYDTPRAGTINLFPIEGIGYNSNVPGRHAGETFHEKDAFAGVFGTPVQRTFRPPVLVNGSVPVTLYEFLSGKQAQMGRDGWGYESVQLK